MRILGRPIVQLIIGISILVSAFSILNYYYLPPAYLDIGSQRFYVNGQPSDWFLLEAVLFLCVGGLLFLGSGGLNEQTLKAALIIAVTGIRYNEDSKVAKFFWMNRFIPIGAFRVGLIFLIAGIIFIALFFITVSV